jgi:NTP pyrophosphatase (non-canonical NTP hydrolase)
MINNMYKQKEIEDWADDKGIYKNPSFYSQMKGIAEEVVETTEEYVLWNHSTLPIDKNALKMELGDIYIFWINACWIAGVDPKDAIDLAYNKIVDRKGHMEDGRFVKAEGQ